MAYQEGDDWFVQLVGGETLDYLGRAVGGAYSRFLVRALRYAASAKSIDQSGSEMDRMLAEANMRSAKDQAQGLLSRAREQCADQADKLAMLDQFAEMMDL